MAVKSPKAAKLVSVWCFIVGSLGLVGVLWVAYQLQGTELRSESGANVQAETATIEVLVQNPVRGVVVGFILGLIIGGTLVYAHDRLTRNKLRSAGTYVWVETMLYGYMFIVVPLVVMILTGYACSGAAATAFLGALTSQILLLGFKVLSPGFQNTGVPTE